MKPDTEKGLPCNVDCERAVLGSIFLNDALLQEVDVGPDVFSLEKHRRIFKKILEIHEAGDHVDRITVANALMASGELESCDGLSYLVSLDDGLPESLNISSYLGIVKEKAALRRLAFLGQHLVNTSLAQEFSSLKIVHDLEKAITKMEIGSEKSSFQSLADIVESYGGRKEFITHAVDPGVSFGFPQWDNLLVGLQPECQYIIAGRTSSGKSALAGNVAVSLAKRGIPVAILGLEMGRGITLARMLCSQAQAPIKYYLRQELTATQMMYVDHAMEEILGLPIYIDDDPHLTITDMAHKINRIVAEKKVRVVFLDHVHRVNWQGDKDLKIRNEYEGITTASWTCCLLARQNKISTVVLCQLNRPPDKRKDDAPPTLNDLRSTGALEFDATGVLMLHRPELYDKTKTDYKGIAEAYVRKSRNGELGMVRMRFKGYCVTFEEDEPGLVPPDEEHAT
jgi:replicative DNA helicase